MTVYPVVFEEDSGTSSRLHPLEHLTFGELLTSCLMIRW
jgi:hypothetical protein